MTEKGSKDNLNLELQKQLEEAKSKQIEEYEKIVDDFQELLANKNELIVRLASSAGKTHVIIQVADAMQHLYELGKSDVPTNEIANHLVKKLEGFVHRSTVWDNLPARFKTHKNNPDHNSDEKNGTVGNPTENSSLNIEPEQENAAWILTINNQLEFLRDFRTKISNSPFVSLLDNETKKNFAETLYRINTIIKLSGKIFDDRQSVPAEFQHLLAASFIESTDSFAAGIYIGHVKDFGANRSKEAREKLKKLADSGQSVVKQPDSLTPKQAMKIELGKVRKVAEIFDPKNRNEALLHGFYGVRCPNPDCNSWRVLTELTGKGIVCHCFACETNFQARSVSKCGQCYLPFYDEIIEVMKKDAVSIEDAAVKTKCPQCEKEVILPIQYMPLITVKK